MSKHAYLIMVHKDLAQIKSLLSAIDYKDNDVFIHVDTSFTECTERALRDSLNHSPLFYQSKIHPAWGSFDQVRTTLSLLDEALSRGPYAYYHLLSGQDLPLRPQSEIHQLLNNNKYNYVHFSPRAEWDRIIPNRVGVNRIPSLATSPIGRKVEALYQRIQLTTGVNKLSDNIEYGFGSQWFSITHGLARDFASHREWIERHFAHGFCVDELVMQSFILTYGYDKTLYPCDEGSYEGCLREIDWSEGNPSPRTWTTQEMPILMSSKRLFARKFDSTIDDRIIGKVLKKAAGEPTGFTSS